MRNSLSKIASLMICLAMLAGMMVCTAFADQTNIDASNAQPTAALDLVILLDDSKSMYKNSDGNDSDAYRFDAAAIMLNMCETSGSRAAVFSYYGSKVKPIIDRNDDLVDIDIGGGNRDAMTAALRDKAVEAATSDGNGNTPMGAALQKAVDLLDSNANTRGNRQPVILILADGEANDPDKVNAAKQQCTKKKYKIYTVYLGKENETDGRSTLIGLSQATAGRSFELTDATDLPNYFAQVFADQTGAALTSTQVTPTQNDDNTWQVEIRVPNRSVKECNIMIPSAELTDIKLTRPNGQEARGTDPDIYTFDVGSAGRQNNKTPRFKQWKIMEPDKEGTQLGTWKLTYNAKNAESAGNIAITVVFNYNLTLVTNTPEISGSKGDDVTIRAYFNDANSKQPSTDGMLYRGQDGIQARAYLLRNPDDKISSTTPSISLDANQSVCCFEKTFRFTDLIGDNRNAYKSGTYYLYISAEGDGLLRNVEKLIEYKVQNSPPALTQSGKEGRELELCINDPNRGNLSAPASTTVDDIGAYLSDADGDIEIQSVTFSSDDPSIASVDVVDADPAHAKLTVTTGGTSGSTRIVGHLTDIEGADSDDFEIKVVVKSVWDTLKEDYELGLEVLTQPDADGAGNYQRGSEVELDVGYKLKDGRGTPVYQLDGYNPEITLFRVVNGNDSDNLIEINNNKAVVTLDGQGGDYTYKAKLTVNGVDFDSKEIKLSTGNVAPSPRADAVWTPDTAVIGCEQFPDTLLGSQGFMSAVDSFFHHLPVLGDPTTSHVNTGSWEVRFGELWEDLNTGDTLNYSYEIVNNDGSIEVEPIPDEKDGRLAGIKITPKAEGNAKIKITATDDYADPASETHEYTVSVRDQHGRTVKALIIHLVILIILFILFKVIRAVTRPRFRNDQLKCSVDGVPQKEWTLGRNVLKTGLNRYVPTGFNFTATMGSAVQIEPTRNGMRIIVKKSVGNKAKLSVGNKTLSNKVKKAEVRRNTGELKAVVDGQVMTWKLYPQARKR